MCCQPPKSDGMCKILGNDEQCSGELPFTFLFSRATHAAKRVLSECAP
jgi:hypothetical protein